LSTSDSAQEIQDNTSATMSMRSRRLNNSGHREHVAYPVSCCENNTPPDTKISTVTGDLSPRLEMFIFSVLFRITQMICFRSTRRFTRHFTPRFRSRGSLKTLVLFPFSHWQLSTALPWQQRLQMLP